MSNEICNCRDSHLTVPGDILTAKCAYCMKPPMKNLHAQALGKLGGQATKKKHGKKHYQKLAENMNKKRRAND